MGVVRKQGKKNRKHGRKKRKPSFIRWKKRHPIEGKKDEPLGIQR